MDNVVAIDGPAGAGKSTVARLLAEKLNLLYVNTGNLYRALAWTALCAGEKLEPLSIDFLAGLTVEPLTDAVMVNGRELGPELRRPECAAAASLISRQSAVRDFLMPVQRNAAARRWIVMEGRDIGTVVFPEARAKFFITASVEERARRRLAQQGETVAGATLASVMAEIAERDHQDSTRAVAPLRPAADALIIDTTGMPVTAVVEKISRRLPAFCRL